MQSIHALHQNTETTLDHATEKVLPPLQHQWPQLGQELFALERAHTNSDSVNQRPLTEQEKCKKREMIRNTIITQLYSSEGEYSRDARYLAFLLVKRGRGGEIVGNPYTMAKKDRKQELPYTGLEGYYAGSERTSQHPGLTCEEIIQEEAKIGAELLKSIKKHAIANNCWADFARLKHVLAGQKPELEELRTLQLFWTGVVKRLHVRIYHNPEFEPTLSEKIEQIEHLLSSAHSSTEQEKQMKRTVEEECLRLRDEYKLLNEVEQEQERQERQRRETIRANRLDEFQQFRETTYEILATSGQGHYSIRVQDRSREDASITEAVMLPDLPDRSTYSPTSVYLTEEQLEGYLFLAHLGDVGGDPLARSLLVSDHF